MSASIEKTNTRPLYSVIIPIYNHGEFLPDAVNSVLTQTLTDWEILIINDGSTDNTQDIINEFVKKDSRIKGFYKENGGVSSALNTGIKNASGEFITWLSADDLFEPDKLEFHYEAATKNPDKKFFISKWYYLLEDTQKKIEAGLWEPIPKTEFNVLHMFHANYIHAISVSIHRSVFNKVGYFDESLIQGQDFDLWLRILLEYEFEFIDKRACTTRIHDGQTTNTFSAGGVFDSTYSLYKNCSKLSFADLFPKGYLDTYENAKSAIYEAIAITFKENAFIHSLGLSSFLVDKINSWMLEECHAKFRRELKDRVTNISREMMKQVSNQELKTILGKLQTPKRKYEYDFIGTAIKTVNKYIESGDQQRALEIERFLERSCRLKHDGWENKNAFQSKYFNKWEAGNTKKLNMEKFNDWSIVPHPAKFNFVLSEALIECPDCSTNFRVKDIYEMTPSVQKTKCICPSCSTLFEFTDDLFESVVLHRNKQLKSTNKKSEYDIAYFVKDTGYLGGGSKIVFKHINWHMQLGSKVTVFSFTSKPDWIESDLNYQKISRIKNLTKYSFDKIVAFSIFDIPELLKYVERDKVFLFCQGYEGYHYGTDYATMRADKFLLTAMHNLPFRTIVVSSHLADLFKEKFGKESSYIPNGIDLNTFYNPVNDFEKRSNSITFIGNPFHLLKGFSFLANTLQGINKSKFKIKDLELNIVYGAKLGEFEEWVAKVEEATGAKVNIYSKLGSTQVAKLVSSSKLLTCTSMYEGFSIPILEAMASGTPVITTSNMGAESFCENEINSFVIDYNDFRSFSEKILLVFYRPEQVKNNVKNGFKTAREYSEYQSLQAFIKSFAPIISTDIPKEKQDQLLNKYITQYEEQPEENNLDIELSFIIPTYNKWKYVSECIETIEKYSPKSYEIIIVNDASEEQVPQDLTNKFTRIISNATNLGFPKSVNKGIESAHGKYLFLVNNDTLATEKSIMRMIEIAESDGKTGIVGAKSNYAAGMQLVKDVPYKTVDEMYKFADTFYNQNKGKLKNFPSVSFLFTLIKREVIDKIGKLDELFSPGYFEDDDFCLRAQLAGYKTVIAEDVFIHHYGSATFKEVYKKESDILYQRSKSKFKDKWGGTPEEIWIEGKALKSKKYKLSSNGSANNDELNSALGFLEKREYAKALPLLESVISSLENANPNMDEVSLQEIIKLSAQAAVLNKDTEKAQAFFEKLLTLNPNSVTACLGLANIFIEYDMQDEAVVMLNWAKKIEPGNIHAEQLLKSIKTATVDENEIEKLILESEALINEDKLTEAEEVLNKILDERPNNFDALNNLSVVEILKKDYQKSLSRIQQVLTLDPSNEIAIENLNYIESQVNPHD